MLYNKLCCTLYYARTQRDHSTNCFAEIITFRYCVLKIFMQIQKLRSSLKMDSRYVCEQCTYKTTKKSSLITHRKSIHEGVKLPCDQCIYKATQKGSLLRHIESRHKGVKFPCDQCDYRATQKGSLLRHMKSIHAGVKNTIL